MTATIALSYLGVTVLRPSFPNNVAFIDPLLGLLVAIGVGSMFMRRSPALAAVRRCSLWLWLIAVGSVIALWGVGLTNWAGDNMLRLAFAVATFFAFWQLLWTYRAERIARGAVAIAMIATTVLLYVLPSGRHRPDALFIGPNYAAHFCAMALILLSATASRLSARLMWIAIGVVGIIGTGSFGALFMLAASGAYGLYRGRERVERALLVVASAGLVALVVLTVALGGVEVDPPESVSVTQSLSSSRFQRSGQGRLDKWREGVESLAESPLGLGPGGVRNRLILGENRELHNDWLAFLVERGVIGLAGLVGLWVTLWLLGTRHGVARLLIPAIVVASFFRETMNYRHMWLILALAFAIDYRRAMEPGKSSSTTNTATAGSVNA